MGAAIGNTHWKKHSSLARRDDARHDPRQDLDTLQRPHRDFVAAPGGMPVLDAESAGRLARRGVLLDARAPERFRGEREPIDPVAGHIPGAVNLPSPELVGESGRFLDRDRLRAKFEAVGVGDQVGAYCGSGVTAAQEVLALELAGYRAALYVGSWSDWITDPERAVAR